MVAWKLPTFKASVFILSSTENVESYEEMEIK